MRLPAQRGQAYPASQPACHHWPCTPAHSTPPRWPLRHLGSAGTLPVISCQEATCSTWQQTLDLLKGCRSAPYTCPCMSKVALCRRSVWVDATLRKHYEACNNASIHCQCLMNENVTAMTAYLLFGSWNKVIWAIFVSFHFTENGPNQPKLAEIGGKNRFCLGFQGEFGVFQICWNRKIPVLRQEYCSRICSTWQMHLP